MSLPIFRVGIGAARRVLNATRCASARVCATKPKASAIYRGRDFSVRAIEGPREKYREGELITPEMLSLIAKERIDAIVIHNFILPPVCINASSKLLSHDIQEYTNAPGIGRLGISFFETTNNSEMEKAYFEQAKPNMDMIRKIFYPGFSPIDTLNVDLNREWPKGADIALRGNRMMFAGLCRALMPGQQILPHEDKLERDDPSYSKQIPLKGQIASNVYLQMPEKGGELELYDKTHTTEEYDRLRKDSYGIPRHLLPKPTLRIKPAEGDLVLFNSRRVHSVAKVEGVKSRLTISCFIGYRGDAYPLTLWS